MDDWGEEGPIFGPYRHIHTTYAVDIKLGSVDGDDRDELLIENAMVYYDGKWHGDWSAFTATPEFIRAGGRHALFDEAKAKPSVRHEVSSGINGCR
jgi:hypothetical protein